MRRAWATVLGVASLACVAGGCRRAPLHNEQGTGVVDAGGVAGSGAGGAGGAGGQGPTGSGGTFDAGVADHVVDEPGNDGFSIGPIRETCPVAPPSHACPIDRPTAGTGCTALRAVCEYGGADVSCRDRWRCADNGIWELSTPGCADRCPPAMPDVGSACDVGAWCSYPEQVLCICPKNPGTWACTSVPDPECPDRIPLHGSACDRGGKRCSYGRCNGFTATCCNGAWATGLSPCGE